MVELRDRIPFLFTSNQFIFRENYEDATPLGWLMRDTADWYRSRELIRSLVRLLEPNIVFGYDPEVVAKLD